jgi:hypothetical protein
MTVCEKNESVSVKKWPVACVKSSVAFQELLTCVRVWRTGVYERNADCLKRFLLRATIVALDKEVTRRSSF